MRHLTVSLCIFLLLLGFIPVGAQLQPTFNTAAQYTGGFPVAIADFNQDGHLDVLDSVSTLLGNGDGTFRNGTLLNIPRASGYIIATADFNGDGKPDIAYLYVDGTPPQSILIFLGKGDGTFQSPLSITPGSSFSNFVVADVNNDGKPDLVTEDGEALVVYLGNGDGTFKELSPNFNQIGQYVVDLNGDGKPDLLDVNGGNSVEVWLGNGDGTFQSTPLVSNLGSSLVGTVADFNHDGKLDLGVEVRLGFCSFSFGVSLGNGDGTFQPMGPQITLPTLPNSDHCPGFAAVAAGDLNGDGIVDVAYSRQPNVAGYTSPIIGTLIGNGDGTFNFGNSYAVGNTGYLSGVALADLNGDHKLDIVAGNSFFGGTPDDLSILMGNGDGSFVAPPALPSSPSVGAIVTADFNGDGKPDVAMLSSTSDGQIAIPIFLDTATGLAQSGTFMPSNGGEPFFVAADLNNDGKQDLLLEGYDQMYAFLGNGDGTFNSSPMNSVLCGGDRAVQGLIDVNGDGIPDLISTDPLVLNICLGNGDGTFGPASEFLAGTNPGTAMFGDFNGDGKLDIAVVNTNEAGQSTIGILLGKGDGTFQPVTFPITNTYLSLLAVADVNLDGKADLITLAGTYGGALEVYLGNGDGTFRALAPQGSFLVTVIRGHLGYNVFELIR